MSKIVDKMETTNQRDPNKTTIITSSEMNQRTFRDEESWASLESTILGGNIAAHNETESSSCAADEIDSAKDKSKLETVNEEQDCTNESRGEDEFGMQKEEAEDEDVVADDSNVLNMNIDAIDDDEVYFDCPTILSPRPYFLGSFIYRPVSPRPAFLRTRPFLTIKTTSTTSSSGLGTSTGDSGLDEERTGAMICQIIDDFNDMGEHAQSTPKIISESSELGSSISSTNNLMSKDKGDKEDNCVVTSEPVDLKSTKKRLEFPMDDVSKNDTTTKGKKKIEVPAETYEFVKNLDLDDKKDEYDSNNNIVTAKKRLERPSEIVRRMKVLCLEGGKIGQNKSEVPDKGDTSEKNVDSSEEKGRGEDETEDLLLGEAVVERNLKAVNEKNSSKEESNSMNKSEMNNNKKKLENSESAKENLGAKKSDLTSCEQSGSQKESNSMNQSEANNNKKLEHSEIAKEKLRTKKSDPTSCKQPGSQKESNSMNKSEANNNKKLEHSEIAKEKLRTKKSDPTSCKQPGSQKESNSMNKSEANNNKKKLENSESAKENLGNKKSDLTMNKSEANNNKKKLENSESAKEKLGTKKSDSTSREQPGNVNITRSIRPPKPINKFYKCRSPADKANKENYYAGKYSNAKKVISPLLSERKQQRQRVAKMKEFFENRSRSDANTTTKKPLIGLKRSPKGPSFHTTISLKLRRASPKLSQASQTSSLNASSYNPINDASTLLLTRNQSRFLRPSSCSDYPSTASSCADKLDQLSTAQKSKSMEDLSSESAQAAELRRFAMSKHVTKRAYLKITQCSTLLKRTPKKQPSPQLLAVNTPKKRNSKIMNRKSLGYLSSPVKPVMELRKIFSPCTAANVNSVKKHAAKTSKTLPHIVISRN